MTALTLPARLATAQERAEAVAAPEQFACICNGSRTAVKGCPAHQFRYAAQEFSRQERLIAAQYEHTEETPDA